ncbi:hypothetical protein LEL_09719 [Akanthomyces lecanii RCEF 1005]|uniref:Uncharacterized protein n=1 Tax=Akanthomyces lecanii RCEF 1005 TaxID=1081108 RepID=A0A168C9V0_CORDF|nr:hypothetical protein LEL_09719 [Akanthomyces lecanii RCEF 1005]
MAPSSTFICGSQGSEAAVLSKPLTALLFHYDTFISDDGGSPCEAAYLSSLANLKVRVLCAPTNIQTIRKTYRGLDVEVQPLQLKDSDLNTKRMLDLMGSTKEDGSTPLYIHVVHKILREMRMNQQLTGESFNYPAFKGEIGNADLTPTQLVPLFQRLAILESFMWQASENKKRRKRELETYNATQWTNEPGSLTIIDLSCPCVTPETACSLFNICLSIFLEQTICCGRVIALDEAHKYMIPSPEATAFTNSLTTAVRLQRHLGVRIVVATQDPTVSPLLLGLCSITIVHRFSSPSWARMLQAHLFTRVKTQDEQDERRWDLFASIARLRTGEALIFSPTIAFTEFDDAKRKNEAKPYMKVRIRSRLSTDGGKSVLAD